MQPCSREGCSPTCWQAWTFPPLQAAALMPWGRGRGADNDAHSREARHLGGLRVHLLILVYASRLFHCFDAHALLRPMKYHSLEALSSPPCCFVAPLRENKGCLKIRMD